MYCTLKIGEVEVTTSLCPKEAIFYSELFILINLTYFRGDFENKFDPIACFVYANNVEVCE